MGYCQDLDRAIDRTEQYLEWKSPNGDPTHVRRVLDAILPHANVSELELLPYHRFGDSKYGFLGRVYALEDFATPTAERLQQLRRRIAQRFEQRGT